MGQDTYTAGKKWVRISKQEHADRVLPSIQTGQMQSRRPILRFDGSSMNEG